ncbi:pseudouridine-5'-phosphatase-like [Oppia nitens]|uniref:pseudouridine-5'-phosphatase-like n=1 Tax=Oppia nitens TaxID=1686743 RepID=UPI0023DB6185|nr:pseudouridine-5'-phosphatase-like [Oppia nitens]
MSSVTTHVIFDLDGTLINTMDTMAKQIAIYANSFGKTVSPDLINNIITSPNSQPYYNEFMNQIHGPGAPRIPDPNEFEESILDQTYESPDLALIPGVNRLVQHLYRHNIPMAIASGGIGRHYESLLLNKNFGNYFEEGLHFSHVVMGWDDPDVVRNKPAPDVYYVCAKRFRTQPPLSYDNVLIVEDSLIGITGALATGLMKTLLVNDQKRTNFKGLTDRITCIANSFDDFRPESVGLPPYYD